VEFSLNLSATYTKWCAQTFPPIFELFAIFDCNFAEIVAPPSDKYENYVVHLKEQSLLKTSLKTGLRAWQTEKNSDKHRIFAPTAGARCAIFPKLCMVIELGETIKNLRFISFDPTHSFSYRVHGKIRQNWPTRGFSAI